MSVRRLATSFVCVFFVVTATAGAQGPAVPPACETGLRWVVNAGSLQHSQADFPLDLQKKYFDSACTFLVIGDNPSEDYREWKAVRTRTATSLATVEAAAADSSTTAVLYDPEGWEMTPPEEQSDPAGAACHAASVVHAHNKVLIVTPAISLIRIIEPGAKETASRLLRERHWRATSRAALTFTKFRRRERRRTRAHTGSLLKPRPSKPALRIRMSW